MLKYVENELLFMEKRVKKDLLAQAFFLVVGPKTQAKKTQNSSSFSTKLKQNCQKTQEIGNF